MLWVSNRYGLRPNTSTVTTTQHNWNVNYTQRSLSHHTLIWLRV